MFQEFITRPEWTHAVMVSSLFLLWVTLRIRRRSVTQVKQCPPRRERRLSRIRWQDMSQEQREEVAKAALAREQWNDQMRHRMTRRQKRDEGLTPHWKNLEVLEMNWRQS